MSEKPEACSGFRFKERRSIMVIQTDMTDTVQQIKDRLSIVDVVSQYVKLERSGQNMRARCPFHAERTPSFFVSPDRGTYHCFGCNVGGDIFSFVEQIEGLDFKGALKILAEKAGVPLVYEKSGDRDEKARLFELMEVATIYYTSKLNEKSIAYLKGRGLDDKTIQSFRIGWAGDQWNELCGYLRKKKFSDAEIVEAGLARKGDRGLLDKFRNRIMFPINDSAGRVIAFSGRIFGENASPEAPKYLNSPETPLFYKSRVLYGFDRAKQSIRKSDCAVLVEGQMDLLASHKVGWDNAVAVSGTAFTPEHAALIRRMTDNLVLALDPDEAGIKAAGRAARVALQAGMNVKVAQLPAGVDPADLILKEGKVGWSKSIKHAKDIITFLLDVLEQHAKSADNFRRSVEMAVLPFLADVKSPIAKEQYVKEVAKRLGVSENAVAEAVKKIPTVEGAAALKDRSQSAKETLGHEKPAFTEGYGRAQQAYGVLLWQKSLKKPNLDLKKYEKSLEDALEKQTLKDLSALPESEKEVLRFSAERLFGASSSIQKDVATLLHVTLKDRLSRELAEVTRVLKKAEIAGDKDETERVMGVHKMLTTRIAKL